MDLSILTGDTMDFGDDDSFLFIRPEEMDDEVTQIFKKWKLNNPPSLPKKDEDIATSVARNETFDSRTFTRPTKRRTFVNELQQVGSSVGTAPKSYLTNSDMQSMESGIASINLQVGGSMTPLSMQKSWLLDVSPPSSICTSMDFQNCDNMLNSLITSSDFTNVSFLLNGTDADKRINNHNNTVTLDKNATLIANNPLNVTRNLMDFTYNVSKRPSNSTFIAAADSEPPLKEIGIENADIELNVSTEDFGKNLTFNKYEGDCANMTWDKIQQIHSAVIQSTPVHNVNDETHDVKLKRNFEDDTLSPISSFHAQLDDDEVEDEEENVVNGDVLLRSLKSRKLIDQIRLEDQYRNSMEDQCEFLLNEETIKLSSRVYGDSFECLDDNLNALRNVSNEVDDEKEFDKMLDSFSVKKSIESEKLLQSVDSIKQRHSLINIEKQREDKKQQASDNRAQYDTMNKSSERLLNRRSRLYDDFNSQLQKQQQQNGIVEGNNEIENDSTVANGAENHSEIVDKNDRDRFKTIKLNRPKLQAGMVIIDTEEPEEIAIPRNEVSPGSNKERQNQINKEKQEEVDKDFKKPAPISKLSKFGYGLSRPSYSSRNNLNLPLKASSTDSLDNDGVSFKPAPPSKKPQVSNMKSPMGIKSKSIHNLMYGAQQQQPSRMASNLKLSSDAAKSQFNLKAPRASSLVRPVNSIVENGYKLPQNENIKSTNPTSRKMNLVRPSSGYYGNAYTTKKLDSDSESYSLSSSSASSRNSVHLSLAPAEREPQLQFSYQKSTEDLRKTNISGAIPKPVAASRPVAMSGLPRPSLKGLSGLPRPRR